MPSDALPDDPETLRAMLLAERVQNERLRQIIKELQRHRFGRRAETLPEDQMLLGLEDVEQAEADLAAETDGSSPADREARAHKRRINRGALPAHLPRIETVVDIDNKTCPCCQGELHWIGEDKSERLDMVPAQFRVLVIRPIALNRKNALFAGSDSGAEHRATIASLIETCKLNDVDPLAYLTDVLARIVNGHPNSDIDQLLPWAYRKPDLQAVA